MSYQVLGLAGPQGAGKDYVYEQLVKMYAGKRNVRRMAFADGVRREVTVEVLSAFPGIEIGDSDGAAHWSKPYTHGQRWLLQQWGTEYRRSQDPDYWVLYGLEYMDKHAQDGDLWVVTDVRFANEAEALSMDPWYTATAQVLADPARRAERVGLTLGELEERSQHASEVIDFKARFTIANFTGPVMGQDLVGWLGLPVSCLKCAFCEPHIWHDCGSAFSG